MRPDLERYFFLGDADRALIGKRRGEQHWLGFALQVTTARLLGVFLEDSLDIPWPGVEHLAARIEVRDPYWVKNYTRRRKRAFDNS